MKQPFLISFSGIDGSGKTQLIVLLRRFLRRQGIPYICIHSVRDSFANRIAKKIPSFKNLIKPKTVLNNENFFGSAPPTGAASPKKISFLSFVIRLFFLILDALYLRIRLLYFAKNYKVIIFDRYSFDRLVQIAYLKRKKGLSFPAWYIKIFPKPNMPLYLHITPEQSLERKAEIASEGQNIEYLKTKHELFEQGKLLWKLIVIDNSVLSISEAKKKMIAIFKKRYYKKLKIKKEKN